MRTLRALTFLLSMTAGWTPGAHAGAGTINASVTPLGDSNVTYSIASPVMDTFVGYTFVLGNAGGNTINNISFTVTATATDPAETVALFNEAQYLPVGCAKTAANVFTCNVGQLKAGADFATFQVFYKAPVRAVNGNADADGSDFINVNMHILYAERLGGPTSPPQNSIRDVDAPPVLLGTANPDRIKSGVPKSGASLYTGLTGGIPTPGNKSTMLAAIPSLTTSATADLEIIRVTDDPIVGDPSCITQGHFRDCPTFKVTIPGVTFTTTPLTTTYRIDASSLKMPANKILNSVLIRYQADTSSPEVPVLACPGLNQPTSTGVPCVNRQQCFKNNAQPPNLAGDCEWELINTRNGLTRFF